MPLLVEVVTPVMRRVIQQSGEFRLETQGNGEIEVRGTFTKHEREGLSSQRNDLLASRDFSLALTAEITVTDRRHGQILFQGALTGRTTVRSGNDLVSAERQALPLLAEDLAKRLSDKLTDGSW